jgi:hypothetical protein
MCAKLIVVYEPVAKYLLSNCKVPVEPLAASIPHAFGKLPDWPLVNVIALFVLKLDILFGFIF